LLTLQLSTTEFGPIRQSVPDSRGGLEKPNFAAAIAGRAIDKARQMRYSPRHFHEGGGAGPVAGGRALRTP
jgi:hypothetical protein